MLLQFGSLAGADHHADRRGQTHRAGTGDDQDRHHVDQRLTQRSLAHQEEPGRKSHSGDHQDHRHEHRHHLIGQPLNGGLLPWAVSTSWMRFGRG